MALGPIHCGSFLIFSAFALLLVGSISAPVFKQIDFLSINSGSTYSSFGIFGYCLSSGTCTGKGVGYDLVQGSGFAANYNWENTALNDVTKGLILQPIACGIAFIAFIIALFAHHIGFIIAALFAFFAFLVSLTAMAIEFALFGVVLHQINNNAPAATAMYGNAMWMSLAATVVLFFASFITCFECCGHRRRRTDREVGNGTYVGNQQPMTQTTGTRTGWFGRRNNKYAY